MSRCGRSVVVLDLYALLASLPSLSFPPPHSPPRREDIKHGEHRFDQSVDDSSNLVNYGARSGQNSRTFERGGDGDVAARTLVQWPTPKKRLTDQANAIMKHVLFLSCSWRPKKSPFRPTGDGRGAACRLFSCSTAPRGCGRKWTPNLHAAHEPVS